jgi:hypothetical protein
MHEAFPRLPKVLEGESLLRREALRNTQLTMDRSPSSSAASTNYLRKQEKTTKKMMLCTCDGTEEGLFCFQSVMICMAHDQNETREVRADSALTSQHRVRILSELCPGGEGDPLSVYRIELSTYKGRYHPLRPRREWNTARAAMAGEQVKVDVAGHASITPIAETHHSNIELLTEPKVRVVVLKRAKGGDERSTLRWRNEVSILGMVLGQVSYLSHPESPKITQRRVEVMLKPSAAALVVHPRIW